MVSYRVEISFDTKKILATIDSQLNIKFDDVSATPNIEELQKIMAVVIQAVYFLRNNSGTKFEVTELTEV